MDRPRIVNCELEDMATYYGKDSNTEKYIETLESEVERLQQERYQLKAILHDVNTSDYRFSVEQLAAHDAEVIERMIHDHKSFFAAGNNRSLLWFAVDRVNQLRQQAKENNNDH